MSLRLVGYMSLHIYFAQENLLQRIRHSFDINHHLFVPPPPPPPPLVLINVINVRGGGGGGGSSWIGDPSSDRAEPERIALKRVTEELKGRLEQ